jgi:O-antigen/teichoic acid export membrane protein
MITERPRATGPEVEGVRGIAQGTTLLLVGSVAGAVLTFGFQALVARSLSVEDVGRYFEATAVAGMTLAICTGGLRFGLVRFTAAHGESASLLARRLTTWDVMLAGLLTVALWLAAPLVAAHVLHDPGVAVVIRTVSVAVPLATLGTLTAAVARGRGAFGHHFLIDQVGPPSARLLSAGAAVALGAGLRGMALAYVAGSCAGALLAVRAGRKLGVFRRRLARSDRALISGALAFSAYRWGVDVLQIVLLWADTLILGAFFSPRIPGIYSVASRVVVFAAFAGTALNLVLAPAAARIGRSVPDLERLYELGARWMAILTFAPLAVVLAAPTQILSLFGARFTAGRSALLILVVGFAFNAIAGPAGTILNMSLLNKLVLLDNILAVVSNVGLNLLLVPRWGMVGAAIAWSSSLFLVNSLMMYQLRVRIDVRVLRPLQLRTGLALSAVLVIEYLLSLLGALPALVGAALAFPVGVAVTRAPEEAGLARALVGSAIRRRPS